ncbi:hypothetical protein L3X38_012451 [Prunus dulcis]|uniref:Receptor ligand binding region domain-containing protein n=1 Tax=Prunus dulcis TaxID=3755 RepID=A0AAD4ZG30_PRUDU|nr:hypothetical protein L3X38_012451 [Prunus dulcis]
MGPRRPNVGTPELPRRHRQASRHNFLGFHRICPAIVLSPPATKSDTWGMMSNLIKRRRAVTTTQSSEPPAQPTSVAIAPASAATMPASAATMPALMDHLAIGPAGSQAPASSASSVAQPVSNRRRHRAASTTNTTSTDASGSQPDETSQVTAISGLIEMFKWRDVILLYENTDYGRDIIPFFFNSFEEANVTIVYKSCIAASSADEQIIEELRNLTKLKSTVFVVHVSHFLVPRLFLNAKRLGLLNEGYAWIMTSTSMNFLHSSMDPSVIESTQGVLGLKSYTPASTRLHNLTSRLRRLLEF